MMLVVGPTPIVHFRSKKENKREQLTFQPLYTPHHMIPHPHQKRSSDPEVRIRRGWRRSWCQFLLLLFAATTKD